MGAALMGTEETLDEQEARERPERDRLMPQACGDCGAEAPADGIPPEHFTWCPGLTCPDCGAEPYEECSWSCSSRWGWNPGRT